MRLFKSRTEISAMRKSARIAAAAHQRAMQVCKPGMNEAEIHAELLHTFTRNQCEASYVPIVGGGANACVLHYIANNQELHDGDLLLIDAGAEYDAYTVNIGQGEQFPSGFVALNPNSKIPTMEDRSGDKPFRVFESAAILIHLAEKFGAFIPSDPAARTQCFNWLFWQVGSAPYLGGGFGHFYSYAPYPMEYPINRSTMETKRQLDVLDKHLANNEFMAGKEYSIADMAIWPWYGNLVLGNLYDAATFLQVHEYTNLVRWAAQLEQREGVKRGRIVNKTWGDDGQLENRHSAKDIDDALANT